MTRAVAFVLVVTACGPPVNASDASLDARADDASIDGALRPPRTYDGGVTFYRACATSGDCDPGARCTAEFPVPRCTTSCRADGDCPESGVCSQNECFRSCMSGGTWCDDDQLCISGACAASCSARTDMPELRCSMGACLSNYCRTDAPGPGAIGAPCATYTDCASLRCQTESTGWPGGMCVRLVRMIPVSEYLIAGPMPSGRCLDAEALGTDDARVTDGDLAYCLSRCTTEADCRDGYRCDRYGATLAPLHDDGYCVRWGCALADLPCEAPRECRPYDAAGHMACMRGP